MSRSVAIALVAAGFVTGAVVALVAIWVWFVKTWPRG